MKIAAVMLLVAALVTCASVACGPARHGGTRVERGESAEAVVSGTCIDAASGEKLSGVKVEAPDGKSAVSGRDGRFEIRNFRSGEGGVLTASLPDGRHASLTLRPLAPGTLEVVLQLAPAR